MGGGNGAGPRAVPAARRRPPRAQGRRPKLGIPQPAKPRTASGRFPTRRPRCCKLPAVILERSMDPGWLSNAYLVGERVGGAAVVVDSGAPIAPLVAALTRHKLRLAAILTTHRHIDHVQGHAELVRAMRAPIFALAPEAPHVVGAGTLEFEEQRIWGGLHVRAVLLLRHTSGHAGYLIGGVGLFTGDCPFAGPLGGTVPHGNSGFDDDRLALDRNMRLTDVTRV